MGIQVPQRNSLSKIGLHLPVVPWFIFSQGWEFV